MYSLFLMTDSLAELCTGGYGGAGGEASGDEAVGGNGGVGRASKYPKGFVSRSDANQTIKGKLFSIAVNLLNNEFLLEGGIGGAGGDAIGKRAKGGEGGEGEAPVFHEEEYGGGNGCWYVTSQSH